MVSKTFAEVKEEWCRKFHDTLGDVIRRLLRGDFAVPFYSGRKLPLPNLNEEQFCVAWIANR